MERGSVVLVSAKGDYGKTRPAVVVQDRRMLQIVGSVTVCLITSELSAEHRFLRINVSPDDLNGLRSDSQVQVEKLMTFPENKVRGPIGHLSDEQMAAIDLGLLVHLGLAAQLGAGGPKS